MANEWLSSKEAARRLGVAPERCLAFEDSNTGLTAAHAAGTMAIMVPDIVPPSPEVLAKCLTVVPDLHAALTLLQARKMAAVPVVLVGAEYWRRLVDIPFLIAEGIIDPEDAELFWYAEDAAAIWDGIRAWYRDAGEDPFAG